MPALLTRRHFLLGTASTLFLTTGLQETLAQAEPPRRRRALLVAVQGYFRAHQAGSVGNLNTRPDVAQLQAILKDKLEFTEFTVLNTKETTTHRAILEALRKFIAETQEGDVLFFHYSGHGSQVEDARDPFGFDQTLVPSDYISDRDGSNDIRDKELAKVLEGVKRQRPAAFLLTFDCCHSGTITRDGGAAKRGFDRILTLTLQTALQQRGGLISADTIAHQGFTAISACRNDEYDCETTGDDGKPMGSLTYALCRSLATATNRTTYGDLFDQITAVMHARGLRQTPVMEGPLNQTLLGGEIVPPSHSIAILTEENGGKPFVQLMAGSLMGIGKGSGVALYPAGTGNFHDSKPIATATVAAAGATRALLQVTYAPGKSFRNLSGARALVTGIKYTESPLRVDLSLVKGHPRAAEIIRSLQELVQGGLITLTTGNAWDIQISPAPRAFAGPASLVRSPGKTDSWEVEVRPRSAGAFAPRRMLLRGADPAKPDSVALVRGSDGSLLTLQVGENDYVQTLANDAHLPGRIAEAIRRETRFRLMSQLPTKIEGPDIHVEMRIILCEVDPDSVDPRAKHYRKDIGELKPGTDGLLEPKVGDYFRIEIRNTGDDPVYVTIADLSSDGAIAPLWPNPRIAAVENRVVPGQDWLPINISDNEYAVYQFGEPTGSETFMVIATREKADFSPLFDTATFARGPITPGTRGFSEAQTPLGKLLSNATTRNVANVSTVSNDWAATPIHLDLQPTDSR